MSDPIDVFMIVRNEEEMLPYSLATLEVMAPWVQRVVFVDNGSTDATLDLLYDWMNFGLPVTLLSETSRSHHGQLRQKALSRCTAPWVLYLDADETFTSDIADWLQSNEREDCDIWDFMKYSTIGDREHYTVEGNGPSTRLFRNLPGVEFPQNIHTHPEHPGLRRKHMAGAQISLWYGPLMFDHTGCASRAKLYDKGQRYQWAQGTVGIGPADEYVFRVWDAYANGRIKRFPADVLRRIHAGPTPLPDKSWRVLADREVRADNPMASDPELEQILARHRHA